MSRKYRTCELCIRLKRVNHLEYCMNPGGTLQRVRNINATCQHWEAKTPELKAEIERREAGRS